MCFHHKEKCANVVSNGSTQCSLWGTNLLFIYKLGHVNNVTSTKAAMETQRVTFALLHYMSQSKALLWCFYVTSNDEIYWCTDAKCPILLTHFHQTLTSLTDFHKSSQHEISWKICWYMPTDGRTWRIGAFCDSRKRAWKLFQICGGWYLGPSTSRPDASRPQDRPFVPSDLWYQLRNKTSSIWTWKQNWL